MRPYAWLLCIPDANITCEIPHIMYIVAKVLQVSVQDIKRYVHTRMSYVSPAMANNAIRRELPVPSQKLYAVPPETGKSCMLHTRTLHCNPRRQMVEQCAAPAAPSQACFEGRRRHTHRRQRRRHHTYIHTSHRHSNHTHTYIPVIDSDTTHVHTHHS